MKRFSWRVTMLLVMVGILAFSGLSVMAEADTAGDWEFTVDGENCTITRYSGSEEKLTVPMKINEYNVTGIGSNAFKDTPVQEIEILSSVTSIDHFAFKGCSNLEAIHVSAFNDHYTSVDGILYNKSVTLLVACPDGVLNVTLPDSVEYLGSTEVFSGSAMNIFASSGNACFSSIDGVLFSKDGTELLRCPGGKTDQYTIPDGVTIIQSHAFNGCENLTSIVIPESVTMIGGAAFQNCKKLASINIPASVVSIDNWAFNICSSLTGVNIPVGQTAIGEFMFSSCRGLTSVYIPASVTDIGSRAFRDCDALVDVYFGGTQAQWNAISIDGDGNEALDRAVIHCLGQ